MTAWSRITWKFLSNFCVFWKTTSYGKIFKILRRKFTRRHQSTLLGSNVVKSVLREIGEIVRYSHDKKSASSQTVATALITPKMFRCQHATFGSDCSKMHPNRFTFGGVIVECVNTVLLTRSALADPKGAGGHAPLAAWASTQNALKVAIFRLKIKKNSREGAMPPPQTPASFPLHKFNHNVVSNTLVFVA